jgi:hypothetical protein
MSITIARLHKHLGELIEQGHSRRPVCVNKESFSHPLELDGAVILNVAKIDIQWVPTASDDGGTKMNRDGSESGKRVLVISGDCDTSLNLNHHHNPQL